MQAHCEVTLTYEDNLELAISADDVERSIVAVLEHESVTRPCCVSVSVVSNATMRALNASWRESNCPTDVLSLECEHPSDPSLAYGEPCQLGDIVLAPSYIADQAREMKVSVQSETILLIVHGMLHLLGYDHRYDEEALVMERIEDEIVLSCTENYQPVTVVRHGKEYV